jgi:hypothetical protein
MGGTGVATLVRSGVLCGAEQGKSVCNFEAVRGTSSPPACFSKLVNLLQSVLCKASSGT